MNKLMTGLDKIVFATLRDCPDARKGEMELLQALWKKQGITLTEQQQTIFLKCFKASKIIESWEKIKEMGFYRQEDNQGRLI